MSDAREVIHAGTLDRAARAAAWRMPRWCGTLDERQSDCAEHLWRLRRGKPLATSIPWTALELTRVKARRLRQAKKHGVLCISTEAREPGMARSAVTGEWFRPVVGLSLKSTTPPPDSSLMMRDLRDCLLRRFDGDPFAQLVIRFLAAGLSLADAAQAGGYSAPWASMTRARIADATRKILDMEPAHA